MESQILQTYRKIENTPYGEELESRVRFGDFKPDHVSNDTWEWMLGDDVNNLRHHLSTYELTKKFMIYHQIGHIVLWDVAITHDWGEVEVGDVALPDKKVQGVDTREVNAYKRIVGTIAPEVDAETASEIIWGEHHLSKPFNAIEYIGYCRTGIRAGKMANLVAGGVVKVPELTRGQTDGLIGGMLALSKMVELKNYPVLAKYTEDYPLIPELL